MNSCAKPNFIVIGEQKCGTGWIRDRLREHPDVYMAPKELNYFSHKSSYEKGLDWYCRRFPADRATYAAIGEKSPDYFWLSPKRTDRVVDPLVSISQCLPQSKIILTVRNPTDRAISAMQHHIRHRGRRINPWRIEKRSVQEILFNNEFKNFVERNGILQRGLYFNRLQYAQKLFGNRLLVLIFEEDVVIDPAKGLEKICSHIDIPYRKELFDLRENAKESKPSLTAIKLGYVFPLLRPLIRMVDFGQPFKLLPSDEDRRTLLDYYAEDIQLTEKLLGISLRSWSR